MSKETAAETTTEELETTKEGKTTEEVEETTEAEGTENEAGAEGETTEDETSEEETTEEATVDEVVVTIGDQAPPQEDEDKKAPEWIRELRKTNRELVRQNRELQRQAAERSTASAEEEVGVKPKLSDFDYDSDKYDEAMDKWTKRKQAATTKAAEREAAEKKQNEAWQTRLTEYGTQKTELKVKDMAEAEAEALGALNQTQQGIIVSGSDNAALVVYALGKNPVKLKELAAITDPVKFAFAVAKLEKDLKVTTKKAPPPPEKTVTGSAPRKGAGDTTLDRLRAEAEKSGDYSKVVAHKKALRAKAS